MALSGAERQAKYRASGKHHEAIRRYRLTAKGKAANKRSNARQLYIGEQYVGYCASAELAHAINRHIKERLSAFQRQQSGAQAKGGS